MVQQLSASDEWQVVELSRSGSSEFHYDCDLGLPDSVSALAATLMPALAEQNWDEVLFINNAGYLQPVSKAERLTADQITNSIAVNQISPMILMSRFYSGFQRFSWR